MKGNRKVSPLDDQERRAACLVVMLFLGTALALVAWEAGKFLLMMMEHGANAPGNF